MPISEYMRNLRQKVGNALLLLPSVTIAIFDDQERILLVKQVETEKWVVPGGSVDPHESPADAAVRKMWEETGLLVEPIRVLGVYGGPEFHVTYANQNEVSYLMTVFECQVISETVRPNTIEAIDLAYFSQADLITLKIPPWMRIVLTDAFSNPHQTLFEKPTWKPPADGIRKGGMSDYARHIRGKIGNDLLIMPAVGGVAFDDQGNILLQKCAQNNWWSVPAGAIDPHESPAEAVVREVWEETGVLVEPSRVTGVYGGQELYFTYANGHQVAVFSIMFECRVIDGQAQPDGIETLDVKFFAPEEVTRDFFPKRWQRRVGDVLTRHVLAQFNPPTWRPPDECSEMTPHV